MALQQVKSEIANDKKIGLRLYTFGHGSRTRIARDGHDLRAVGLLYPVIRAAANVLTVDFHFDDGQLAAPSERGALSIDAINGNSDIPHRQLLGDAPDQCELVDEVDTINRNQEAILANLSGRCAIIRSMNRMSSKACNGNWMEI